MKKILLLTFFIFVKLCTVAQTVNYSALSSIIANPERGLQKFSITAPNYSTTIGANNLSVSTLNSWKNSSDKVTVVYRCFLLDSFINSDINSIYLNNMQTDFNNIRTSGSKVIIRFSYSDVYGSDIQQASKAQILQHIAQLSSIINNNKDMILCQQAGFIGSYGEWYNTNSTEFGTAGFISAAQWNNRKDIVDAILASTPIEIPLQLRTVAYKTALYGTIPLSDATAYQNTPNARLGFYNDSFLNNYGDLGTFAVGICDNPVGTDEYIYLSNETKFLPMSGETSAINTCDNGFRTTGANAIYEMGLTNWSTINRDYFPGFWDQVSANQYNEIVKKLGYRFVLNTSTITSNTSNFDIALNITNEGFARPFSERNVYLVMKNTSTNAITTQLINTDIRTWETNVSITQNFNPGITGTFQLYLWMPDKQPSLSSNSDYAIQLANNGTWESATGYNNLLQTVTLNILGIADYSDKNRIKIYPNPSNSIISLEFLYSTSIEKVIITDITGKIVKEQTTNTNVVNVENLANGLYILEAYNGEKKMVSKFIKE
jgi:hypothetical protein